MASALRNVRDQLRKAVFCGDGAGLSDGQLLECFVSAGEEAALAALVRRHAGMIWGVCRRQLRNHHDAEDAFQATYLVLVRKASSIAPREMVAAWLHGVAYQIARKARRVVARRSFRERQVLHLPEPEACTPELWHDLKQVLDAELERLPPKYRIVLILCDLEGKKRKEAARQLRVPEGTVAGRLARARRMLAKRLTRRGVTLSGAALSGMCTQAASACAPGPVVSATINVTSLLAAGKVAALPPTVAALMKGIITMMLLNKLKLPAVALLLAAGMLFGASLIGRPATDGEPAQAPPRQGAARSAKPLDNIELDRKALQGTWKFLAFERQFDSSFSQADMKVQGEPFQRLTFSGNECVRELKVDEDTTNVTRLRFTLYRSGSVTWITFYPKSRKLGEPAGPPTPAWMYSYSIRGDQLTLTHHRDPDPNKKGLLLHHHFKRQKPGEITLETPAPPAAAAPADRAALPGSLDKARGREARLPFTPLRAAKDANLIGEWTSGEDGKAFTVIVDLTNSIQLLAENGEHFKGTWAADWSKQPAHLDLQWRESVKVVVFNGKCPFIVELSEEGQVRLEQPSGDSGSGLRRATRFSEESWLLTKRARLAPVSRQADADVARELARADANRRDGRPIVASYHLELVRQRYPNTSHARIAAARLAELFPTDEAILHGKWVGKDVENGEWAITFGPKNALQMHTAEGISKGTYAVDLQKRPQQLRITLEKVAGKSGIVNYPSLLQFLSADEIKIAPPRADGSLGNDLAHGIVLKKLTALDSR